MTPVPDTETLTRLFSYDPESGKLFFNKRTPDMFTATEGRSAQHQCGLFNSKHGGKEAGSRNSEGYICVKLHHRTLKAHRIIWKMVYGTEPDCIDHINQKPSDNSLKNLRAVSQSINSQNKRIQSNNTSGVSGVYFSEGKWTAAIQIGPKRTKLGRFQTKEEAVEARRDAEARLGFNGVTPDQLMNREDTSLRRRA